jgi:hypothetical protein
MKNRITVDLTMPAAERIKLLAELTKQARADKLAEAQKAKVEMAKAYFNMPKWLKTRFANACGTRSQNEIIVELIERFTKQAERNKPVSQQTETVATKINLPLDESNSHRGDSGNAGWLDLTQL